MEKQNLLFNTLEGIQCGKKDCEKVYNRENVVWYLSTIQEVLAKKEISNQIRGLMKSKLRYTDHAFLKMKM